MLRMLVVSHIKARGVSDLERARGTQDIDYSYTFLWIDFPLDRLLLLFSMIMIKVAPCTVCEFMDACVQDIAMV